MKKTFLKRAVFFAIAICLILALAGCADDAEDTGQITELEQLASESIGVLTGSVFDTYTDEFIEDAAKEYYNTYADMVIAVKQGIISAFLIDEPMARVLCQENDGIRYLDEYLTQDSYAFAFPKDEDGERLRDQMNEFLTKISSDGTLEQIEEIWFGTDEDAKTVQDWTQLPAENGTLIFITKIDSAPFAYVKDNDTVGYDVDVATRFCQEYGYGLQIEDADTTAFISGIESGRYDFGAAGFTVTQEREESMYFSQANYTGGIVAVVADSGTVSAKFETLQDFSGADVGAVTGTIHDQI